MITVWTLTVDADEIAVTVHPSEEAALDALFENFDPEDEYGRDMQRLLDGQGIVVYIDEHEVEVVHENAR